MTQRIIYTSPEGNLCVVIPAPGFTAQDCIKDVPAGITHEIVDVATIPSDRTFRNAWKHDPTLKVDIDVPKAKLITHDKRRIKREVELAPLDKQVNISVGNPQAQTAAESARQVIRDKYAVMQINIDACTSAVQLKAIITTEGL